jgi:hypothetical protein
MEVSREQLDLLERYIPRGNWSWFISVAIEVALELIKTDEGKLLLAKVGENSKQIREQMRRGAADQRFDEVLKKREEMRKRERK